VDESRRSNASNWQRFLDQPRSISRHFRRVNFNNSTLSFPPHHRDSLSCRDDSHDFSGGFQLSEDPRSHERTSERCLAKYRSSRTLSFSPLLRPLPPLSLSPGAIVAFAGVGSRTGSGRNEKLRVIVTRTRVIARNYDFYDVFWKNVRVACRLIGRLLDVKFPNYRVRGTSCLKSCFRWSSYWDLVDRL